MTDPGLVARRGETRDFLRSFPFALAAIVVLGAALRLAGASGDLWFDEIWSLQNLEGLSNPGQILWGISQDNNHFLNSSWLWTTGPDAPPFVLRAMSIAFGIGSIVMAARIVRREAGNVGALVAALLVGLSPILVQYGSEARGYSGMIFCLLWALDASVRFIDRPNAQRPRLEFGLAVALGSLSHLQMLPAAVLLAAGVLACIALRSRDAATLARCAGNLGSALLLGAAPVALAIVAGLLNTHVIRFGDQTPFTFSNWADGLAGMAQATTGLPQSLGTAGTLLLATGLVTSAMAFVRQDISRLAAALVFGLPLAEAVLQMPNVHIPRFHLACAVALLVVCAVALGRLWIRSGVARMSAVVLLAAFIAGAVLDLAPFLRLGLGDYAEAIRVMGNGTYSSDAETIAKRTVRYYAPRTGAKLEWKAADHCAAPPEWFIHVEDNRAAGELSRAATVGPPDCKRNYRFIATYPYAGLSGFRWSIYRREND